MHEEWDEVKCLLLQRKEVWTHKHTLWNTFFNVICF